jgi:hypothetical protein
VALKKFFGAELQKAMDALVEAWTLNAELEELQKASAMGALAARTGRTRPSAYAPLREKKKEKTGMGLKERLKQVIGRRPPGAGWTPVPGGKKGGYRKMERGKWLYWYPGMGKEGGSQEEAERHQATKEIAHHEKESEKWRERAAKRSEQGQHRSHVEAAREKMRHHAGEAQKLREKHGIRKSMEKTMTTKEGKELHFRELEAKIRASGGAGDPAAVAAKVYRRAGGRPSPRGKKTEKGGGGAAGGPRDTRGLGPRDGRGGQCEGRMAKDHSAAEISKLADQVQGGMKLDEAMDKLKGDKESQENLLAELRGRKKSMKPADKPEKDEIMKEKSIRVNHCTIHLDPDEALAKAIEGGHLGIGTVPRTFSSKTMNRLEKAVGGERWSEHGQDMREAVARVQQDAEVLRDDPAGNDGNGGLAEWFTDAQRTQEPMVRTPAVMAKSEPPPTRVIDDDDPYTRRLHQADPRDKSAAFDIDQLFNKR